MQKQFKFATKSDNFIWQFNELSCVVLEIDSLRRTLHWPADASWQVCEMWRCPVGTGTHTHTLALTHPTTPAPPASPLTTAAVLQEAAVPLADQILSVTFPLINGHLLPPFSLHGYTLSLCTSNHLIVVTSDLIWARLAADGDHPPYLPHTSWGATKATNQQPTDPPGNIISVNIYYYYLKLLLKL